MVYFRFFLVDRIVSVADVKFNLFYQDASGFPFVEPDYNSTDMLGSSREGEKKGWYKKSIADLNRLGR